MMDCLFSFQLFILLINLTIKCFAHFHVELNIRNTYVCILNADLLSQNIRLRIVQFGFYNISHSN